MNIGGKSIGLYFLLEKKLSFLICNKSFDDSSFHLNVTSFFLIVVYNMKKVYIINTRLYGLYLKIGSLIIPKLLQ